MDTIDDILDKHTWPKRIFSDHDFLEIERQIGFQLPNDYKGFLSRYQGHEQIIGKQYLVLWDKDLLLSSNEGYEVVQNLPLTVGIGSNGGGELIAVELKDRIPRVVLTPLIDLNGENNIEIGKSFTDFLVRMDAGQDWFKDV